MWDQNNPSIGHPWNRGPLPDQSYRFLVLPILANRRIGERIRMNHWLDYYLEGDEPAALMRYENPAPVAPGLHVYDDRSGGEPLSGNPVTRDEDPDSRRALHLTWHFSERSGSQVDTHVYVRENDDAFRFLGQTMDGETSFFTWSAEPLFQTAQRYRAGPKPGSTYRFRVVSMGTDGPLERMESQPVQFMVSDR